MKSNQYTDYKIGDLVYIWSEKTTLSEGKIIDDSEKPFFKVRYETSSGLIFETPLPFSIIYGTYEDAIQSYITYIPYIEKRKNEC